MVATYTFDAGPNACIFLTEKVRSQIGWKVQNVLFQISLSSCKTHPFLSVCRSRGSFVEAFLCRQRGAKLLSRGGGGGGGGGRGQVVGQLDSVQGGRRLEVPDPHITWRGARGLAGAVASLLILNFYPLFTRVTVMLCLTRMGCPKTLSDDLNANGTHCKSIALSCWTLPYSHCYQKLSTNYWYGNTL